MVEHAVRTGDMTVAEALAALRHFPGWAVFFVEGRWFVGDPAHFPSARMALAPRCTKNRACSRVDAHHGDCEPWAE
jgi:hypothetical protein